MERESLPKKFQQIYSGKYQIMEGVGAPEAKIKPTPSVETESVQPPRLDKRLTEDIAKTMCTKRSNSWTTYDF